jgi:tetratricopeptide (TPR) repeat protein
MRGISVAALIGKRVSTVMHSRVLARVVVALSLLAGGEASAQSEDLGTTYRHAVAEYERGNYDAALPLFQSALELAQQQHGPDAPELATDYNNLGEVYRQLGRLDDARRMFETAVQLDSASARPNPANRATSLNNLALVERAGGRLAQAERLHEEALQLLETSLGATHPDVARSLNNLAVVYLEEGHPDQALPLAERALQIAETSLGGSHGTTETIAQNVQTIEQAMVDEDATPAAAAAPAAVSPPSRPAAAPSPEAPPPTVTPLQENAQVAAVAAPSAAQDAVPTRGDFHIHVASVREENAVSEEYARLVRRYPLIGEYPIKPTQKIDVPGRGTYWRVLAGEFSTREAALQACQSIHTMGAECRVVSR